ATGAALGAVALAPAVASADPFEVTSTNDSGPGSLRAAAAQANEAPTGPRTIVVPAGTYTLTSGELDLTASMTITGAGSGAGGTVIDGDNLSRAFEIAPEATVEIDGVSIVNGNPGGESTGCTGATNPEPGGAILDQGTLTLTQDSVSDSLAAGSGGAIEDAGTGALTISDTTLTGNTACDVQSEAFDGFGAGGGIDEASGGNVTISGSTITDNAAAEAGGGLAEEGGGSVSITDTTLSGNTAGSEGGAIDAEGGGQVSLDSDTLSGNTAGGADDGGDGGGFHVNGDSVTVLNSTITGNTAGDGGGAEASGSGTATFSFSTIVGNTATDTEGWGIGNLEAEDTDGTAFTLDNSIVGGGVGVDPATTGEFPSDSKAPSSNCGPEVAQAFQSNGNNLFDDTSDDGAQCGKVSSDLVNAGIGVDALANNGGPTETMALKADSPAIGKADTGACKSEAENVDQRGDKRPGQGDKCDIGAFEYSPPAPAVPTPNPPVTPTSTPQNTVTTTNTTAPTADLSLVKRASQRRALVGSKLTYTLAVTNHGPSADTGVKISDHLPRGLSLISEPGACHGRRTISCSVGSLAAGAHAAVVLVVRATRVGTVTNMATTTGTVADPKMRNNRASATVHVLPLPRCGALVLRDRIDSDDLVPTVQVYIDGRLVRTLHGHNLRHLALTGPAGMRSFRLRVVFRADDLRNAIATTQVRGCHMGAVSWQWLALPGALNED
ncbi:MAG: choice-of-anchor Q domain-containing protein, partial [Solirubrobacteraceae bacterium]